MLKGKRKDITSQESDETSDDELINLRNDKRPRRVIDVIDSMGDNELPPCHHRPQRLKTTKHETSQEYFSTPESVNIFMPDWSLRQPDRLDATPNTNFDDEIAAGSSIQLAKMANMPTIKEATCYNMNHKNRGKCVVFNHEIFDTGFDNREGSSHDAKRIERTFKKLDFTVEILEDLKHRDILEKIETLKQEDHSESDCICIFVLTHGLNNDLICAKDVAYSSDNIWKAFTADKCPSLAGKPKLFFYQACRGDKLDSGILLQRSAVRTETDSAEAAYKIPTHADFLIAHSTVQGFFSWRNPLEGTWYIKCLCDIIDEYADSTDLVKMLTMTARKVATDYESFHDLNPAKHEQKQVPSLTSMLIRDLYFFKKSRT